MQTQNQKQSSMPVVPVAQQQEASPFRAAVVPSVPTIPAPVEYAVPKASMAEGGLLQEGGSVDPVSGNEVPTGSLKEEVRDDIPAQLSEGEFVFPADVVRFIGLERLMQMRQEAKEGLRKMEAMGQMGNSEEATIDDDEDFETDLDEIMRGVERDEAFEMYVGGMIRKKYANGGLASETPNMDQQMESGAMTTPTTMSSRQIIRKEIQDNPEKQELAQSALEAVASNSAVMVRENNSVFVLSTITPGIMRMNTFSADDPERLADSIEKAIPVLKASNVNGVEVVEDKPGIREAFEQAGLKTLPKAEGVFVVDLTGGV